MQQMANDFAQVAEKAGSLLTNMQNQLLSVRYKAEGDLVTDADLASHVLISSELRRLYPGHNLILEETDHADSIPDTYIVADELDGTVIYANGLPEWGISIAHVKNGIPVVGVLHQPTHKVTVAAWIKGGTWIGKKRVTLDGKQSLSECISLVELNRFLEDDHISWISRICKKQSCDEKLGFSNWKFLGTD